VDLRRDPAVRPEPLGEADVIGVAVGQDERADVVERPAHGGQLLRQIGPVAGHPGVDDRDLAGLLDEIGIDVAVADAMERRGNLHSPILR
jgi:hypothetical protein